MEASQGWPIAAPNIPALYCYEPVNLNASVEGNLVLFTWTSPHDNDGFYLIYTPAAGVPVQVTVFGSGTQISLLPNTLYSWSVRTMCDRLANRGSATVIGAPFTTGTESLLCGTINTDGALIIKSSNTTRIEWTAQGSCRSYEVEVGMIDSGSLNPLHIVYNNYITLTTLNADTEYRWRVRPVCPGKITNWSTWQYLTTGVGIETASVAISAVFDVTTAVVYWTNIDEAVTYQVYLNGTLVSINHPVNIITLQCLLPLTTYTIVIIPNFVSGPGDMATLIITTLDYSVANPTNVVIGTNATHDVIITWTPAAGIDSQEIIINGTTYPLSDVAATYTFPSTSDTNYSILLRSVKGAEKSTGVYNTYRITTFCQAPVLSTSKTDTSIGITWPTVPGAESYTGRYSLSGLGTWTTFTTVLAAVLLRDLFSAQPYDIEVQSVCAESVLSPVSAITETTLAVPVCVLVTDIIGSNIQPTSMDITFETEDLRDSGPYQVQVQQGVNPAVYFPTTVKSASITGLTENLAYTISVINDCSLNPSTSAPVTISTIKSCTAPAGLTASLMTNNTVLTASWAAAFAPMFTAYAIRYRQLGATEWQTLPNQLGLSFTTPCVSSMYQVQVTALYSDGRSCTSEAITDIPKVLSVTGTDFSNWPTINWTAIQGVDRYKVSVTTLTDTFDIYTLTASLTLAKLDMLVSHSIVVYAEYNSAFGPGSDPLVFTTNNTVVEEPSDCIGVEAEAFYQDSNLNDPTVTVNTKIDIVVRILNYNEAYSYRVDVVISGQAVPLETRLIEINQLNADGIVIFKKFVAANTYRVIVTAFQGDLACPAIIDVNTVTCIAPIGLATVATTSDSITISWTDVPSAESYLVYMDGVLVGEVTESPFYIGGLEELTTYKFKVRSRCDALITSSNSAEHSVTTDAGV